MTDGQHRSLGGFLIVFILAVFTFGCSSGGDGSSTDTPNTGTTPTTFIGVVADPGPIVGVTVNSQAVLDGGFSSGPRGATLSYDWTFNSKPDGSTAKLQNENSVRPSFTADVKGSYTIELIVSSGEFTSRPTIALVEAYDMADFPNGLSPQETNHTTNYTSTCASENCHEKSATPKVPNHIATSNLCQACHTIFSFTTIPNVNHEQVFGNCSGCHDGVLAVGKSDKHVPTTAECDDCHNVTSFLELALDGSYDHNGVKEGCDRCHNGIVATGKHDGHIPTEGDCSLCHITDNFQTVTFDHSSITENCATCHDGTTARGKSIDHPSLTPPEPDCGMCHNTRVFTPVNVDHTDAAILVQECADCHDNNPIIGLSFNHMPITVDCGVCHTPGTFATGVFDHNGVVDNCASCHDGIISTGLSPNHLPIDNKDCSVCHLNTNTFAGAKFDHTGIIDNCTSCHDGAMAPGKTANHIPTQDDCSVCHTASGTTNSFIPSTFTHVGITKGCEGCHKDENGAQKFPVALSKSSAPTKHVPTNEDCYICHTTDAFKPATFSHAGITGNCVSCHDGNYTGVGARGLSPTHISTTEDCGVCHNTRDFKDAFIDHSGPQVVGKLCASCHDGTQALGAPNDTIHNNTTEDCGICHVPGTFTTAVFDHTGIVDNCVSCHGGNTPVATVAPNDPIHINTTQDCSVCHNTTAFAGAKFDHTGIQGNCASCHDGTTAIGKTPNHVPTLGDCGDCHLTTGFIPATFDHVGIVDNCVSCHDGIFAIGKPNDPVHNNTVQDCGVCHNSTTTFIGAVFDHTGIVDNCASCHDGITATGLSPNHLPTTLDCHMCHTTATFVGGTWVHGPETDGVCLDCHATGKGATPMPPPPGHFQTTVQCDVCHNTNSWAPANAFVHPINSTYPGDHNRNVGCISCHTNNSQDVPFPSTRNRNLPPFAQSLYHPACAGCHEADFRPEGDHIGGNNGTVEQNKNCGASGCHRVNANGF